MRICVITPYHKETLEVIDSAHKSVLQQDLKVTHIMVADGHPNPLVSTWDCHHIVLPEAHHDAGNFARGVGALHAFQRGAEYVCFLDADNWLETNHVSSLYQAMFKFNADIGVSRRMLRRLDCSILDPFDAESDGVRFADTGTVMLSRSAIEIAALWATLPVSLSGAGDQIIWSAIKHRGFKITLTELATMNYKTKWAVHYTGRNEDAPEGTVDLGYVRAANECWLLLPESDKRRLIVGRS